MINATPNYDVDRNLQISDCGKMLHTNITLYSNLIYVLANNIPCVTLYLHHDVRCSNAMNLSYIEYLGLQSHDRNSKLIRLIEDCQCFFYKFS